MKLRQFHTLPRGLFMSTLMFNMLAITAVQGAPLLMKAVIAGKDLGCEMTLRESVLQFNPLRTNQLMGAIQTHQIMPLRMQLACIDETKDILPTLFLTGETPYAQDTSQTIFLNGTPNGVGFMVRQSTDNTPISQANFYQPSAAIGSGGTGHPLAMLNSGNLHQYETLLWVGVVGPFQPNIIVGHFHASLTLNVVFQ